MSTKSSKTEERIDPRTKRAALESMAIDDYPGQAGEYDVYSASGSVYRVDIVTGACTCPDYEQRKPANGCKHARRVAMEIGVIEIPDLDQDTDVERMIESRDRLTADQETDPQPVADGGQPDSHDGGCPHDHELCEGRDSPREHPELCFPCWKAEAQYEPELIEADD